MYQFISRFLYLTKGHHKSLVGIGFLFLFISGLEVFGTGMIGPFVAIATNPGMVQSNYWLNLVYQKLHFHNEDQFLIFLGLVVTIAFYLKAFFSFNAQKTVFRFGFNLRGELSYKLMKSYLEAPYSFHLGVNSANLIHNIATTTETFCLYVVMPLLTFFSNTVIVIALMLLLIKTDPLALILIAVLLPVVLVLLKSTKNRLARWGKSGWGAAGEMIRILNHGLGGLKETRVIGCEAYFENQMEEQTKKYATNLTLAQAYGNLPRFAMEAVMISFVVSFTLLYININRGNGQNLTSVLGVFALASIRLLPAIGMVVSNLNNARTNSFSVEKLFSDLKELEREDLIKPKVELVQGTKSFPQNQTQQPFSFSDKIIVDKITFQYPKATKNALNEISLAIQKGQSIGLIGKSGSGKTTLVDVLLGLFTPQSGDIKVDDISVYSDLRAWQNMLGYVPQSIFLIDDTLERNIAFGVPDDLIDQNRLRKSIEMAQLNEVVEQLPHGMQTVLGERGVLLSGGQRQRVGIARVLYHEREIIVFDEATAALDSETEHLVTEATKALSGIKTIIIIAHRLSTIEHCDRIYRLENGQIIKSGTYQEVVLDDPQKIN
jgi:ATP-binding cassette, subfamily B, bacterial PglK